MHLPVQSNRKPNFHGYRRLRTYQGSKAKDEMTLGNPSCFLLCCSFSCSSSQRFSVFQLLMGKLGCIWNTMAENLISRALVGVCFPCSTKRHQLINVLQTSSSFLLQQLQFRHFFWYTYILEEVSVLICISNNASPLHKKILLYLFCVVTKLLLLQVASLWNVKMFCAVFQKRVVLLPLFFCLPFTIPSSNFAEYSFQNQTDFPDCVKQQLIWIMP